MNIITIIKKPIVTEKSLGITKDNKYTFEVAKEATKQQIKAAIKHIFNVDAISIRTTIKKPVSVATGKKRMPGKTSTIKKAIVEIKQGQSIKVFETKG
jgi:large subunit ribosomal protein L23